MKHTVFLLALIIMIPLSVLLGNTQVQGASLKGANQEYFFTSVEGNSVSSAETGKTTILIFGTTTCAIQDRPFSILPKVLGFQIPISVWFLQKSAIRRKVKLKPLGTVLTAAPLLFVMKKTGEAFLTPCRSIPLRRQAECPLRF